jgi:hypothetical protein
MKKMVIRVLVTDGTGNIYNALIDKGSFRNHPVWASSSGPFLRHIHVHVGGLFTFKCAFFVSVVGGRLTCPGVPKCAQCAGYKVRLVGPIVVLGVFVASGPGKLYSWGCIPVGTD